MSDAAPRLASLTVEGLEPDALSVIERVGRDALSSPYVFTLLCVSDVADLASRGVTSRAATVRLAGAVGSRAGDPAQTVRLAVLADDEAGSGGGVATHESMGEATFVEGRVSVRLEDIPAVCLTALTSRNTENCLGSCDTPSQMVVDIME